MRDSGAATTTTATISEPKKKLDNTSQSLFAVNAQTYTESVADVPCGKNSIPHHNHTKNTVVFDENAKSIVHARTNLSPSNAPPLTEELT